MLFPKNNDTKNFTANAPRLRRDKLRHPDLSGDAEDAKKKSSFVFPLRSLGCFASLAMTFLCGLFLSVDKTKSRR